MMDSETGRSKGYGFISVSSSKCKLLMIKGPYATFFKSNLLISQWMTS